MAFEAKYAELIRNIHGQEVKSRPPLGPNPFTVTTPATAPVISFGAGRYLSPAIRGVVVFDYSNNNGRFTFGAGDMTFETAWSRAGNNSIQAYIDPPSIRSVAISVSAQEISEIQDATQHDPFSRWRTPYLGEILVWQNTAGYFLATKVLFIQVRGPGNALDEVRLEYRIAPTKSSSFAE